MSLLVEEIEKLFNIDENGCFSNLILPNDELGQEVNMIGRKTTSLSINEIVRIKQYSNKLYEESLKRKLG